MRTKQFYCGLDVHKDTIFSAIFTNKAHGEVQEFSTLTPDIMAMGLWLKEQGVIKLPWRARVYTGFLCGIF